MGKKPKLDVKSAAAVYAYGKLVVKDDPLVLYWDGKQYRLSTRSREAIESQGYGYICTIHGKNGKEEKFYEEDEYHVNEIPTAEDG